MLKAMRRKVQCWEFAEMSCETFRRLKGQCSDVLIVTTASDTIQGKVSRREEWALALPMRRALRVVREGTAEPVKVQKDKARAWPTSCSCMTWKPRKTER